MILILKTGRTLPEIQQQFGDFEFLFTHGMAQGNTQVVDLERGDSLPDINEFSGVVITGSPAMVTDDAPWSMAAEEWIRQNVATSVPILGVCYGHQLIARALGGEVKLNPLGRQIGTINIHRCEANDRLFAGLPKQFLAQATHLQSVTQLPENAVRLATTALDPNHAFRIGENIWCIQFHPEFNAWMMKVYLRVRGEEIRSEGLDWNALNQTVHDATQGQDVLPKFHSLCANA